MQLTRRLLANKDEHRSEEKATSIPHCCVGPTVPVLAAASSGVGERQGGVNGVEMRMVAKFGTLGQAGEASTREHNTRRDSEIVDMHAGIMDTRGHRVNSPLRPTNVQRSCLACCSW